MSFVSQVINRVREHARIDAEVDNMNVDDLNGLGLTRGEMRKIAHMPQEQIDRMEKWQAFLTSKLIACASQVSRSRLHAVVPIAAKTKPANPRSLRVHPQKR